MSRRSSGLVLLGLVAAAHGRRLGLGLAGRRLAERWGRDEPQRAAPAAQPPRVAAAFPLSLRRNPFAGRKKRLKQPIRELQVQGMELRPTPEELAQIARDEGLLGRTTMPTEEEVAPLVRRVRDWYSKRGYPLVGTMAMLSPADGVVRVITRVPMTAKDPVDLVYLDPDAAPAKKLGRTRARAVAKALGLKAGEPFRLNSKALYRLLDEETGPFEAMLEPQVRVSDAGDARVVLAVCERNFTEIAPTLGIRGTEWYAQLSAKDTNLNGRMQSLAVELSKYNSSSASIKFDDPRLGRKVGFGAELWVDNVQPEAVSRNPFIRRLGGYFPSRIGDVELVSEDAEGASADGAKHTGMRRRTDLERAGLTLRWAARRDKPWRVEVSACAQKVAPRTAGGIVRMGAPGAMDMASFGDEEPSSSASSKLALDVPVTLTASAISQDRANVVHRVSAVRTLPVHRRCPDYYALDYRVRSKLKTALPRLTARLSGQACVASSGQPDYLMRSLGGSATVRGMSTGQLGLARALTAGRAEVRLQIGGKKPGKSIFFVALFTDAGGGLVLRDEPKPTTAEPEPEESEAAVEVEPDDEPASERIFPRTLRPAGGGCVGAGIIVGPVRFEYTFATTREWRKTINFDTLL